MTRTFGLELLESVLNDFPQVFLKVSIWGRVKVGFFGVFWFRKGKTLSFNIDTFAIKV